MATIKKTLDEAIQSGFNVDIRSINETIELQKEVSNFHQCEIVLLFNIYDGAEKFEHCVLVLQSVPFEIYIMKNYKGKYCIYENASKGFNNILHYTKLDIIEKIKCPNEIGKLSTKKIQEWIDYIIACYELIKAENDKNTNEINSFLESLKDEKVQWYEENESGKIIKNGIEFSFKISDGCIVQTLQVHYSIPVCLESFKALSNNKLGAL